MCPESSEQVNVEFNINSIIAHLQVIWWYLDYKWSFLFLGSGPRTGGGRARKVLIMKSLTSVSQLELLFPHNRFCISISSRLCFKARAAVILGGAWRLIQLKRGVGGVCWNEPEKRDEEMVSVKCFLCVPCTIWIREVRKVLSLSFVLLASNPWNQPPWELCRVHNPKTNDVLVLNNLWFMHETNVVPVRAGQCGDLTDLLEPALCIWLLSDCCLDGPVSRPVQQLAQD